MPRLVFTETPFAERSFEFVLETTRVGRSEANNLVIRDARVSRTHCEILVWRDEVIVRDLGSCNGTLLNGRCLRRQQAQMQPGQVLQIGAIKARLELDVPQRPSPVAITDTGSGQEPRSQRRDSETVDSITAVHAYVRFLRSRAETGKGANALHAKVVLDGGAGIDSEKPTTVASVLPGPHNQEAASATNPVPPQEQPSNRVRRRAGWMQWCFKWWRREK